jgi:hypothetical protein
LRCVTRKYRGVNRKINTFLGLEKYRGVSRKINTFLGLKKYRGGV